MNFFRKIMITIKFLFYFLFFVFGSLRVVHSPLLRKTSISNWSTVLILKLIGFSILDNRAIRWTDFWLFRQCLESPCHFWQVSFTNKYSPVEAINDSDSLNRSHYWAFIKDALISTVMTRCSKCQQKHWLTIPHMSFFYLYILYMSFFI